MDRLPVAKPTAADWKKLNFPGQFKVHVKAMGTSRWMICSELPGELQFDEWLYLGKDGIPIMYWNTTLEGVMLI